jgi:hypothetical protein
VLTGEFQRGDTVTRLEDRVDTRLATDHVSPVRLDAVVHCRALRAQRLAGLQRDEVKALSSAVRARWDDAVDAPSGGRWLMSAIDAVDGSSTGARVP